MYQCKFGQNPSTSSEDNARKPYFGHFKVPVTLKMRSRSPKIYSTLPLLSTMFICKFGQNSSTGSEDNARKRKSGSQRWQDPHQKQYIPHAPCWEDITNLWQIQIKILNSGVIVKTFSHHSRTVWAIWLFYCVILTEFIRSTLNSMSSLKLAFDGELISYHGVQ